jgi:hypothetical protein
MNRSHKRVGFSQNENAEIVFSGCDLRTENSQFLFLGSGLSMLVFAKVAVRTAAQLMIATHFLTFFGAHCAQNQRSGFAIRLTT